jgi:hypothetical protein
VGRKAREEHGDEEEAQPGKDVGEVCRELQVSEQTYYRWRNQFGGLKADDAKRLKDLERENATLKRLLADAELEKAALKGDRPGKLLGPERRRAAVHHLIATMKVSERFACLVTGQNRRTQRHQPAASTPADPDAELRRWLRQYAKDHPRSGLRRAYHDARGERWTVNHKIQRLWREEGLRVPQRRRRKRLGEHDERHPEGRCTEPGLGGRLPVRRHHRRQAGQDRVHRRRAHP